MAANQKQGRRRDDAAQVFRQFAWHLAGTLAGSKAAVDKSRPPAPAGKR
ncbi:MAG TPA: hypothetical protein VGN80_07625 [Devosiaceae bacterium]|jgi:hypothetical protein|nr:hypothetical protein [Devosiaceae bacterium]